MRILLVPLNLSVDKRVESACLDMARAPAQVRQTILVFAEPAISGGVTMELINHFHWKGPDIRSYRR